MNMASELVDDFNQGYTEYVYACIYCRLYWAVISVTFLSPKEMYICAVYLIWVHYSI